MDAAAILSLALVALAAVLAVWVRHRFKRFVVHDHEWGLHYRDGKLRGLLEPGAYRRFSPPHEVVTLDKRRSLEVVAGQEVLTGDNVGLKLSLVAEVRNAEPLKIVGELQDARQQLHHAVQVAARKAVAGRTLEQLLAGRETVAAEVQEDVAAALAPLGLEVLGVTLRDFMLGKEIRGAYGAVVSARKEGEAALERARGEQAALRSLANAARMLKDNPDLMQLRVLQTMAQGDGAARTFVLGVPPGHPEPAGPPHENGKQQA